MASTARAVLILALAAVAGSTAAEAQREDSFRWYLGAQGGVLFFKTPTQSSTGIGLVGLHTLIMAKRTGLYISAEEAFGTDETSAFADPNAVSGVTNVVFDRIRKYTFALMAFPVPGRVEPFVGVGGGILQVRRLGTDTFGAKSEAEDRGSTGFATFIGGVQAQLSRVVSIYGQYQITTAPNDSKLLSGAGHSIVGGLRFSLGSAKDRVGAGGY